MPFWISRQANMPFSASPQLPHSVQILRVVPTSSSVDVYNRRPNSRSEDEGKKDDEEGKDITQPGACYDHLTTSRDGRIPSLNARSGRLVATGWWWRRRRIGGGRSRCRGSRRWGSGSLGCGRRGGGVLLPPRCGHLSVETSIGTGRRTAAAEARAVALVASALHNNRRGSRSGRSGGSGRSGRSSDRSSGRCWGRGGDEDGRAGRGRWRGSRSRLSGAVLLLGLGLILVLRLLGLGVDGEDHGLAAVSAGLLLAVEP